MVHSSPLLRGNAKTELSECSLSFTDDRMRRQCHSVPELSNSGEAKANTDAELYKLSSGEGHAHENLGLKNSPFCLRKSQQTPRGRAFLLKVTWWENPASYYRSHLRTSCFWGGVCVQMCMCVRVQRLLGMAGVSF